MYYHAGRTETKGHFGLSISGLSWTIACAEEEDEADAEEEDEADAVEEVEVEDIF